MQPVRPSPASLSFLALLQASDVRARLSAKVATALESSTSRIARVAVDASPGATPLAWLQAMPAGSRLYWSGRDDHLAVAGSGAALRVRGDGALPRLEPNADRDIRFFGGVRFDSWRRSAAEWGPFGDRTFVLPRFELVQRFDGCSLVCNLVLPGDREASSRLLAEIERLPLGTTGERMVGALPSVLGRRDAPDRAGWERNVRRVLAALASTTLGKVVLARRTVLTVDADVDPALLLDRLRESTPGCFHFLFEAEDEATFLGASPERLYRREHDLVWSEAVAGTRSRAASEQEDSILREELLHSEKDQREHEYVRQSIKEALGQLCRTLHLDEEASEMRLARGRHLYSGLTGRLHEGVTDERLLGALHPTPAVGGHPTREALDCIARLEPFDRGWYAGPVGWLGVRGAEFAVAIRSGLVRGREISLYSGAGIVRGSHPDSEWEEIEQKIADFQRILGHDVAGA